MSLYIRIILKIWFKFWKIQEHQLILINFINLYESIKSDLYIGLEGVRYTLKDKVYNSMLIKKIKIQINNKYLKNKS